MKIEDVRLFRFRDIAPNQADEVVCRHTGKQHPSIAVQDTFATMVEVLGTRYKDRTRTSHRFLTRP